MMTKPVQAQEVLLSDADWPAVQKASPVATSHARTAGTDSVPAPFPFLDDFSYTALRPSSVYWAADSLDDHVPGISTQKGLNVPSKGVCTFDGATFSGRKYEDELVTGAADSLVSNFFDLSTKSIADSLYLTFFLQRGGTGEAPESSDSMVVYFDSTGNYDWTEVWNLQGTGTSEDTFVRAEILLDTAIYFHSAFRFKFVNFGSLNGEFDQWHLDYVYFDEGRQQNDFTFSDASPTHFTMSPFFPWTHISREQFVQGDYKSEVGTIVRSAGSVSLTANVNLRIDAPDGNNILSGTTTASGSTPGLTPFGGSEVVTAAFADQAANMTRDGNIRLRAITSAGGDTRSENDTLYAEYSVDSLMGYDDGVSDQAYGLTVARHFCQEYRLSSPDTLTAVWINFTPTLHYNSVTNQSTCLDFKSFKLVVWDTLVPDSQLTSVSSGMNVSYDSSLNDFRRYELLAPVVVDTLFWVGIRQSDDMPLGVGFDRNGPTGKVYFEDGNGDFSLSSNQGCLMIRPEFGHERVMASAGESADVDRLRLRLSPNP
ncbi:MAG: hypothetical protein AAF570_18980, partial [Bacteroidota bacterium]